MVVKAMDPNGKEQVTLCRVPKPPARVETKGAVQPVVLSTVNYTKLIAPAPTQTSPPILHFFRHIDFYEYL